MLDQSYYGMLDIIEYSPLKDSLCSLYISQLYPSNAIIARDSRNSAIRDDIILIADSIN